jgi:galactokinase
LVTLAREAGAAGARLTGAGMGGCIVALAPADEVDRIVSHLAATFYAEREWEGSLEDHLFVAQPAAGASVERT